jgi:hypothetical protein
MTYPGIEGQRGVFWINPQAFQVRQSFAGGYPGSPHYQSVVNSWGSYAPAWAVTAAANTPVEEAQDDPHPIEQDNFELPNTEGGTKQFGVDPTSPSEFIDNADPGYTGE